MTDLITPQLVKQRVDAIAALNQWLIEGLEQNRVEDSGVCAKVALSVSEG